MTTGAATQGLHLARWTCTSGSNTQSRGAVVVESAGHRWEASAEGNGPVDALFRAVDSAMRDVLTGHPQLIAYDVHAMSGGTDAVGRVTVEIAPPAAAEGARAAGRYEGESKSANIIAASVEAYIEAIDRMLAEEHWAGAAEEAGRRRGRGKATDGPGAEFDKEAARHDTTAWFER